jgi:hypothetical protein
MDCSPKNVGSRRLNVDSPFQRPRRASQSSTACDYCCSRRQRSRRRRSILLIAKAEALRRSVVRRVSRRFAACRTWVLAAERGEAACVFLSKTVSWFARQNVRVERVMTDNGSAFVQAAARVTWLVCSG